MLPLLFELSSFVVGDVLKIHLSFMRGKTVHA